MLKSFVLPLYPRVVFVLWPFFRDISVKSIPKRIFDELSVINSILSWDLFAINILLFSYTEFNSSLILSEISGIKVIAERGSAVDGTSEYKFIFLWIISDEDGVVLDLSDFKALSFLVFLSAKNLLPSTFK